MPTKQELETAVKVIKEVAGDPVIGVIAELVKDIERASATDKEVRVVEAKETR
jgi:hypothetical protein